MIPTIITSSKGRLEHLKQSIESWLAFTPCKIVVVDYDCPDGTHSWVLRELSGSRRVDTIALKPGEHTFNKGRALNAGVRQCMNRFAFFFDADTRVTADFWPWIQVRLAPGFDHKMFLAEPSAEAVDLTGVLGIRLDHFAAVGGYDESMLGWGSEDLDLRLRLFVAWKPETVFMPAGLFSPIAHDDALRTRFYDEKDKLQSHQRNLQRLVNKLEASTGVGIADHLKDPLIQSLFSCARKP